MRVRLLAAAGLLATAGCLAPVDPSASADIAAVHATIGDAGFAADTIQVRTTTRVHATAVAAAGYDLGVAGFTYTSSNTGVAVVDENGTVRGVAIGSATITATAPRGGKSASVSVVVVPSTIAYTIAVGGSPGPIAFSTDYTHAYVATANDSLVVVDALGFFRTSAAPVGAGGASGIAATSSEVYTAHFALDSVSRVTTGSTQPLPDVFAGAGPSDVVAVGSLAYVAARYDRHITILDAGDVAGVIPLGGEPHHLALDRDKALLFATVDEGSAAWRVAIIHPASTDTAGSFAIAPGPTAIAASASGDRVYVLYATEQLVRVYASSGGLYALQGTVATGTSPGGIAARQVGDIPYVVVSGEPATVFDGVSLQVYDRVPGAGTGAVAIRPDGLFAFVSAPGTTAVNVLGL